LTLANHYYNKITPDGSALALYAHVERKRSLEKFLERLKKLDKQATDLDLFETINVLLRAGASQAYLADRIGVGKATINRWSNRMTAPQPIVREIAILRCQEMLQEIIGIAKVS
jgi:Trp operon repressor